ncbi:hypothetical protein ACKXGF_13440 [Alkalibacillus sp. S2W]|uniref:hypothetical protein n=1 Tax=Alkalibacillus sp. S2W TaxID=3386553 RepID=UPI00398D04A1
MDYRQAYVIPGGMFVGLGIGMFFDQAGAGVILGLGLGFLLSPIVGLFERRMNRDQQNK